MKARANNGKTPKLKGPGLAEGSAVVFPGPDGWELWTGPAGRPACTGPAEVPGKLSPAAGCTMSLPSRAFFSLPLWVPVVEESPARSRPR